MRHRRVRRGRARASRGRGGSQRGVAFAAVPVITHSATSPSRFSCHRGSGDMGARFRKPGGIDGVVRIDVCYITGL